MTGDAAMTRGSRSSAGRVLLGALLVVSLVGTTRLVAGTWLQFQNTIESNGRWVSGKTELERSVMGAAAAMVTRTMTWDNRLNLGSWFGFQDIRWHEPLALAELDVAVLYTEDRHVNIWFGGGSEGRVGIRLSKHDRLPTAWWIEGPDGLMTSVREFYPPLLHDWNDIEIRFEQDGRFRVRINEREVLQAQGPITEPGTFGFKGGMDDTFIDNVRIQTRDGDEIWEDFSHHRHEAAAHVVALALLLALCLGAAKLRGPGTPVAFPALLVVGVVAACATLIEQVDSRAIWPLYPDEDEIDYGTYPQSSVRESDVTDAMIEQFGDHEGPVGGRILFLGTSQTYGSGASTVEKTWVARVCEGLNARVVATPPAFECMNTGLPGSASPELWKLYRDHWSKLKPDLMIANLGNNDGSAEGLSTSAKRLTEFNQERGIATWFVLEATTSDMGPSRNSSKHEVLRSVSTEYGLPAPSEMQAHIFGERGRGHLWWDFVHPTDGGHLLIAEKILEDGADLAMSVRARAIGIAEPPEPE